MKDYENEEHNLNKLNYNLSQKQKIIEWLRSLEIRLPLGFNLDIEPILFFKDG